ncbi:MAG TPA: response regulator transcription factor [Gemmatimonadaceae bacterium]|jgi:DNA-binding response OmpR family regulator|nr:MAG: DNA-binding response regulator [Gemmatimonadetes bacterium SCN 70-22]HMN08403.1 response regulator transcription factor [Gemmatimonadaceae bacterium]
MRLLFVEDDARIAESAASYLRKVGMAVDIAATGEDALRLAALNEYDIAVLDVRLPGIDGFEVCRRLRFSGYPIRILMATARDTVEDRIAGLDLGADDYVVKPYVLAELEARVRALLRRPATVVPVKLQVEDLTLDTGTRIAERNGREISLTSKEYAVLEYLMRHPGEVVTREKISAHAWDDNYDPASNVIDVYIARLRKKIDDPAEAPLVSTIRGAGYRLGTPKHARLR